MRVRDPSRDRPAGRRVVRLRAGRFRRARRVYGDDPAAVARAFVDGRRAWLHVVDLDGARSGTPAHEPEIAADRGRGRRTGRRSRSRAGFADEAAVAGVLSAGAARVGRRDRGSRRSRLRPSARRRSTDRTGSWSPSTSAMARPSGMAGSDGATGLDAIDAVERLVRRRCRDVRGHGHRAGRSPRRVRTSPSTSDSWPSSVGAIIASGGIATVADLEAVRDIGCAGAIIGRALYEGSHRSRGRRSRSPTHDRRSGQSVSGGVPPGRLDLLAVGVHHLFGDVPRHVVVVVEGGGERATTLGQ